MGECANEEGGMTNLWIGGPGITAHSHYDSNHNYYVQLYGYKRFLLSPPSQLRHFYLYPSAHPSFRQSQVNFTKVDYETFPKFQPLKTYDVRSSEWGMEVKKK